MLEKNQKPSISSLGGKELDDKELDGISGGGFLADWFLSDKLYKSGTTPKYKVGDRVIYHFYGVSPDIITESGVITHVSEEKFGLFCPEFRYTIVHDLDGYVDEGVFESSIIRYCWY